MAIARPLLLAHVVLAAGVDVEECSSHADCRADDAAISLLQGTVQRSKGISLHKVEGAARGKAGWAVAPADFSNSMTLSALVDAEAARAPGTLAAFAGTEVRGVQDVPSVPPFGPMKGKPIYQITIYGDTGGEDITFEFQSADGTVTPLEEEVTFKVNENIGNVLAPKVLTPVGPPPANLENVWTVIPSDFEHSMTMTVFVHMPSAHTTPGTLAAFSGGQCRGVQDAPLVPPFGPMKGYVMYGLMVYGKSGEPITFKFKAADGTVTPLRETFAFRTNANMGSVVSPLMFHAA